VRYLAERGLIVKRPDGTYCLTPIGKETANNLSESAQKQLKQPKLSLLIVVSRQSPNGNTEYLFQRRLRQPFYGYWGLLSGPAQWGEDFITTAGKELQKQTGFTAAMTVRTFLHQRDYAEAGELLEDKLFVLINASLDDATSVPHSWKHGENAWMTIQELQKQPLYFTLTSRALRAFEDATFAELKQVINIEQY
jgi:ADP-ribose pyrophosphatase YjhB (NUDIX family)